MTLEELGNLGEFIGGIAVVATLIYVAVQIRQNNSLIRANTDSVNAASVIAFQTFFTTPASQVVQDESFADIFLRGLSEPDSLSPSEAIRFQSHLQIIFVAFDSGFKLLRSGAMDETHWEPWSLHIRAWMGNPAVRAWWRNQKTPFSEEFKDYVQVITSGDAKTPAAQQGPGS